MSLLRLVQSPQITIATRCSGVREMADRHKKGYYIAKSFFVEDADFWGREIGPGGLECTGTTVVPVRIYFIIKYVQRFRWSVLNNYVRYGSTGTLVHVKGLSHTVRILYRYSTYRNHLLASPFTNNKKGEDSLEPSFFCPARPLKQKAVCTHKVLRRLHIKNLK